MARRPCTFRKTDVTRAAKAVLRPVFSSPVSKSTAMGPSSSCLANPLRRMKRQTICKSSYEAASLCSPPPPLRYPQAAEEWLGPFLQHSDMGAQRRVSGEE